MVTEDKADYSTDEGWLAEVRVNSNLPNSNLPNSSSSISQ